MTKPRPALRCKEHKALVTENFDGVRICLSGCADLKKEDTYLATRDSAEEYHPAPRNRIERGTVVDGSD